MALIRQVVDADPMKFIGNVNPGARLAVSEAMRQANDARHHAGADLGRRDTLPTRELQFQKLCRIRMHIGVPGIECDTVGAISLLNGGQLLSGFRESRLPANLFPSAVVLSQRVAQALRVLVKRLQCEGLWAEEAAAQDILMVRADFSGSPRLRALPMSLLYVLLISA